MYYRFYSLIRPPDLCHACFVLPLNLNQANILVMAGGKWISVRFEILASLFVGAVAFSAVIMSQDAGEFVLQKEASP